MYNMHQPKNSASSYDPILSGKKREGAYTMNEFFIKEFTGGPFVLFSTSHLVAIGLIVLLNLSFLWIRRSHNPQRNKTIRYIMAAVLILNELLWHIWNLSTGQWSVKTMLPLHVCSVFVFLCAIMLVTRNFQIYEFAYFLGIAGATQAILTPDLGIYDFPHFRYYQVFVSHGLIVSSAVYMTLVEGFRPTWRSLRRVIIGTNVYLIFVGIVNALLGSNYMFVAHKPETASLIDVLGPWPWYILALEGIGFVLFFLLYLPFAIRDLRVRRAAAVITHPV
jgi:hypothetical integral membrane protein (TIGR02206 family)